MCRQKHSIMTFIFIEIFLSENFDNSWHIKNYSGLIKDRNGLFFYGFYLLGAVLNSFLTVIRNGNEIKCQLVIK